MAFGDQPDSPKGGSPEAAKGILTQIKGLLHQYIDLGESTPLFGEAKTFLGDIEDGLQRLDSNSGAESPPADKAAGDQASGSGDSSPSDFRGATRAARKAVQDGTLMADDGAKTSDGEQPQDEEDKKRTKAPY